MKRKDDLNDDLELREEVDDGGDEVVKKKEKKGKSREQKARERRIIFWTILVVVLITLFFWLWPRIKRGEPIFVEDNFAQQGTRGKNFVKYQL